MPLFKRKEKPRTPQPGAPQLSGLNLSNNQSFVRLAQTANANEATVQTAAQNVNGRPTDSNRLPTPATTAATDGMNGRKFGTMQDLSSAAKGSNGPRDPHSPAPRSQHRPQSSSLSRSASHGAVPYHLPWTRNIQIENDEASRKEGELAPVSENCPTKTPPRRRTGPPLPVFNNPAASLPAAAGMYQPGPAPPIDFRTSPSTIPQPSPSQRRSVIEAARRQSLKRSKAPIELNIMVMGASATGKTSFVRALLATCDLSLCSEEVKIAAAMFGIASDNRHATYDTDPITPLQTTQYSTLSGIDLHPNALIPIPALESGTADLGTRFGTNVRPQSVFSGRMSTASGANSGRVQLSICDTPGLDFEVEDGFEVERKVGAALRHIETRLGKTLSEESKVQRQQRGDAHVHLVLYFIDPRFMVERVAARKARCERVRLVSAARGREDKEAEERKKQQEKIQQQQRAARTADVRRSRSTSLFGQMAVPAGPAANVGGDVLSKQAQTAQLRKSMEAVQAKAAGVGAGAGTTARPSSKDSTMSGVMGAAPEDAMEDEDSTGVEGLSQQQLAILSRLSQRANVLPVIAKADTLTQAQLDDVRTAVKNSIVRAGLDLGAFDVDGGARKKKTSAGLPGSRRDTNASSRAETEQPPMTAPSSESAIDSSLDTPMHSSPVKVIRIKSRRSYSATGGERMTASLSGHSVFGHSTDDGHDSGSVLGHTQPLFESKPVGSTAGHGDDDEEDDVPPPGALAKMIPFSVFVPEPIRVRQRGGRSLSNGPERKGSMGSIAEHRVRPPVPPLPRDFAKQSLPDTATSSSAGMEDSMETEELLDEEGSVAGRAHKGHTSSVDSTDSSVVPSKDDEDTTITAFDKANGSSKLPPLFTPLPPSRRFQRDFRFGHANMLDARQCDFALLRTCILGTHVDSLRESTGQRYERFRSQRLELRRLTRQASSSGLLRPATETVPIQQS